MERKLISHVTFISIGLSFVIFLISGYYTSFFDACGILIGSFLGCLNLYFLKKLLEEWLKQEKDGLKFYTMIGIKFPLLYLSGYGVLKLNLFPILNVILGFSLIFIAIFLLGLTTQFTSKLQAKNRI